MRILSTGIVLVVALLGSVKAQERTPAQPAKPDWAWATEASLSKTADDALVAQGKGYRAQMKPGGMRFQVPQQVAGGATPEMRLAFAGARRGATVLANGEWVKPVEDGMSVVYERGPILERYLVRDAEVEQTFELATKPDGAGDLVISIDVNGNVSAPMWDEPRHGAIGFLVDGGRALEYGAAFVLERGGKKTSIETAWDGQGRIELIVPRALLESATYPLLVDPVISSPFQPGGPWGNDVEPAVAHDPELGTWMVVWERVYSTDSDIIAAIFDEDGTQIGFNLLIESSSSIDAENPDVAFVPGQGAISANRFMVVYQETPAGSPVYQLRGRWTDSDTDTVLGSVIQITGPTPGSHERPTIASGKTLLVAWEHTNNGATSPTQIRCRTINYGFGSTAVTLGYVRVIMSVTSGWVASVDLAQSSFSHVDSSGNDRSTWFATYERFWVTPAPGDTDVEVAIFETYGSTGIQDWVYGPSVVPGPAVSVDEVKPSVAVVAAHREDRANGRYLVAFQENNDVMGQLYSTTGPIGSNFGIANDAAKNEEAPDVAGGYCEFTVAYLDITQGFNIDIRAARVLTDGTVAKSDILVSDPGFVEQGMVDAGSRPLLRPTATSADLRNTSVIAWWGQTGPSGGALNDINAVTFEPVAGIASFFGTGCPGPNGMTPSIGYTGGLPHPGNLNFAVTLLNGPPNSLAYLVTSTIALPTTPIPGAPGCNAYIDAPYTLYPVTTNGGGGAQFNSPIPCLPSLAGFYVGGQWAILTPGFNAAGYVLSGVLDIYFVD